VCAPVVQRLPPDATDGDLLLRLWEPKDAPLLHQAIVDNMEHLRPWMAWIAFEPLTVDQRRELIAQWQREWEAGRHAPMAMMVDGVVVGGTGYVRREGSSALEIGYWVHLEHLGRGYATRATRALTTAVFDAGVVSEVEVHHDKANVRSGLVPPRLGFEFIGERPDGVTSPGEVGVDCGWRTTAAAWSSAC